MKSHASRDCIYMPPASTLLTQNSLLFPKFGQTNLLKMTLLQIILREVKTNPFCGNYLQGTRHDFKARTLQGGF